MRRIPFFVLTMLLVACAGCGNRVPAVPAAARGQEPRGVPLQPWRGQGRLEVSAPGQRTSLDCYLRAEGAAGLDIVLVSDGGLQVAEIAIDSDGQHVRQCLPELREHLPLIANLATAAWLPVSTQSRRWNDDRLVLHGAAGDYWFGGDPLLLRRVENSGWPVELADFRCVGDELLAFEATANGPFGASLRVRLHTVHSDALTPSPAVAP